MNEVYETMGKFGLPGFVLLLLLMLFRGDIVTKREHTQALKSRDEWKRAADKANQALLIQAQTQPEVLESMRIQNRVMRAIPTGDAHDGEGDDPEGVRPQGTD